MSDDNNYDLRGGLRLEKYNKLANGSILPAILPRRLIMPLLQHIGTPTLPCVVVGDTVLKGQIIARCDNSESNTPLSAPLHASSSGVIAAIEQHAVPHPSGLEADCIIIETDGEDRWQTHNSVADCEEYDAEKLRNIIALAGIVGLGGAGFPAHLKIMSSTIHTLILNGAECEPYITCDEYLMRERAQEVLIGAKILSLALGGIKRCCIALEDNKPEALAALKAAQKTVDINSEQVDIVTVPTLYPMGGEQQLIKALTGEALSRKTLPKDIGILVHNVGTAAAIYRAVRLGQPLISRIVTITGDGVKVPQNREVLLGTPMQDVLDVCGYQSNTAQLIMGGPMMGFSLPHTDLPIIKTTNCLIAATPQLFSPKDAVMPCIRCGACESVCPAHLLPQQLYWHARAKDFSKIEDFNLFDCIECGCCAYVCPSQIPLVHYYRYAKSETRSLQKEREKSDVARQRFEFRAVRLERDKAERKNRHKVKRNVTDKQAVIKAALARAKAKKVT